MLMLTITECQALCFHIKLFCLWISRLPFADFKLTKASPQIRGEFAIILHILLFIHLCTDGETHAAVLQECIFDDLQLKNTFYFSLWNEPLAVLWGTRSFKRGCLCCQSKAEQWLRLISILMNANWHICYGGLAVQTLQLAWLINYPPAGGSLQMEAGKRDERAWEEKWTENCPKLNKSDALFD